MRNRTSWNVNQSKISLNTVNPIRQILETMDIRPNPEKQMIALSIGDPTVFGNLSACNEIIEAVVDSVKSMKFNGYAPSTGYQEAREAVAKHCSCTGAEVEAKDIVLTSACSHAIDIAITVLANPGQNILIPKPGFSLYRTLAEGLGIKCKSYRLLPESDWEVDLEDLELQIDSMTAAVIINNPSNPCGSVFSKEHLRAILAITERNYVPIIADEIYDYFVFPGKEFFPIASLSTEVPILTCGGLTKRYLVPGWRMGWIIIHDRNEIFSAQIRRGLQSLSQRIMGCNTVIQGALPDILSNTPKSFFDDTIAVVHANAVIAYGVLKNVQGLHPIMPSGAMYMMVRIELASFPGFDNGMEFVEQLVAEQSVFCLPGMCFDVPDFFRIVLTVPEEQMTQACERIVEFCRMHHVNQKHLPRSHVLVPNVVTMPV